MRRTIYNCDNCRVDFTIPEDEGYKRESHQIGIFPADDHTLTPKELFDLCAGCMQVITKNLRHKEV